MEPELKPCPKCGIEPHLAISFAGKYIVRVICTHCGLHTTDYKVSEKDQTLSQAKQQVAEAWNAGRYLVRVEDLSINYERLSQAAENLGLFLALIDEGVLEPAERVKRWDAIRREMRDSVRLVRKEVEQNLPPAPSLKGGEL